LFKQTQQLSHRGFGGLEGSCVVVLERNPGAPNFLRSFFPASSNFATKFVLSLLAPVGKDNISPCHAYCGKCLLDDLR
jgi:hypothetical protein